VAGTGAREVTGTGTPSAQVATVAGVGVREVTGTGTPSAQVATVAGVGVREVTGTGTPSAQVATVAGTGAVGGVITGTGALASPVATVAGVGVREVTGTGTPSAQVATVAGVGAVGGVITGTGALASPVATVAGVGVRVITGNLIERITDPDFDNASDWQIVAGTPVVSGGTVTFSSFAGIQAVYPIPTVEGEPKGKKRFYEIVVDEVPTTGVATISSGNVELFTIGMGAGTYSGYFYSLTDESNTTIVAFISPGFGQFIVSRLSITEDESLTPSESTVNGTGTVEKPVITGTGALASPVATVAGVGVREVTGTGTPSAQVATVAGTGIRTVTGAGALAANDSVVDGIGGKTGIITGTGTLLSFPATVSGSDFKRIEYYTSVVNEVNACSVVEGTANVTTEYILKAVV
jgi:hypothetical protein